MGQKDFARSWLVWYSLEEGLGVMILKGDFGGVECFYQFGSTPISNGVFIDYQIDLI